MLMDGPLASGRLHLSLAARFGCRLPPMRAHHRRYYARIREQFGISISKFGA